MFERLCSEIQSMSVLPRGHAWAKVCRYDVDVSCGICMSVCRYVTRICEQLSLDTCLGPHLSHLRFARHYICVSHVRKVTTAPGRNMFERRWTETELAQ
jgi:hypothetical protein